MTATSSAVSAGVSTLLVPAAGLGTRMLPATRAVPKEMLPLIDRPIIQYGVEEAFAAGIRRVVLVTNPGNMLSMRHFAPAPDLEAELERRGKSEQLQMVRALPAMAEMSVVPQAEPRGLGDAVLCGRAAVGDAPFAVLLPDDIIDAVPPALAQMLDVFRETGGPVLLVERVPRARVSSYGIIGAEPVRAGVWRVTDLVEKPMPEEAPSDLAIIGRYVLTPDLFEALEATEAGAGGEVQLTDALRRLLASRPIHACELRGTRLDAGNQLGFLKAGIHLALRRPELAAELRAWLTEELDTDG